MARKSKIDVATAALLKIHKANALERMVYVALSVASFLVLLSMALYGYFVKGDIDSDELIPLFAATGVIGVCISRVLSMWRDCVRTLIAVIESEKGGDDGRIE